MGNFAIVGGGRLARHFSRYFHLLDPPIPAVIGAHPFCLHAPKQEPVYYADGEALAKTINKIMETNP